MSITEWMDDDMADDIADSKTDLKAVVDRLDVEMARVLDEADLNPDDPQSYIVLRMALATFTKLRLSVREQAMIADDTAAYFEKVAEKLRAEMRNSPSFLH